MEILGFRMRTGEDVVATVVEREPGGLITISKPVSPIQSPHEQGKMMLISWLPFSIDEKITLSNRDYVASPYRVPKGLEDAYLEATSGLAVARASIK